MKNSVAIIDDRPFFEKAIRYGLKHGILARDNISKMEADGLKGIVQIADHFGTAYLRTDLETAAARMKNLISLYLEDFANGDLQTAALSLRDNSLLSHSRGGSEMLKRLHAMPVDNGLYGRKPDPLAQKIFVNERSFAFPLTCASYRAMVRQCQANQMRIDFARWLASLDALEALLTQGNYKWVVPSHGPVHSGLAGLQQTRDWLKWLTNAMQTSADKGLDLNEVLHQPNVPPRFANWAAMPAELQRSLTQWFPLYEARALTR